MIEPLINHEFFEIEVIPSLSPDITNLEFIDIIILADKNNDAALTEKVRSNKDYFYIPILFIKFEADEKIPGDPFYDKNFISLFDKAESVTIQLFSVLRKAEIIKAFGFKAPVQEVKKDKIKILVVEDEDYLKLLFKFNLEKSGFECLTAENGVKGFEMVKTNKPDLILSDIMMPLMDGYEFRKKLLDDPNLKDIPFVFLTAKGGEDSMLEGYNLGITDYILKTTGNKILIAKINAIIASLGKERDKVVGELQKAVDSVLVKVVPDQAPKFDGFEVNHHHQTFEGIPGGDFLDYIQIDENNYAIVLGDVMGKKWKAWYFALAYAGYIRSTIRVAMHLTNELSSAKIMTHINQLVYKDAKLSEVFTTLSILVLNNKKGVAYYTGAGDLPIIHKSGSGNSSKLVKSNGMLLGMMDNSIYEEVEIILDSGDRLYLYTDGVNESKNEKREQFGIERLIKVITELKVVPDKSSLKEIISNVNEFTLNQFDDDVSLIEVVRK